MGPSQTSEDGDGDVSTKATGLAAIVSQFGRKRGPKDAALPAGGGPAKKVAAQAKAKSSSGASAAANAGRVQATKPTKPGSSQLTTAATDFSCMSDLKQMASYWEEAAANITVEVKQGQGKKTAEEVTAADTKFMVEICSNLIVVADMSDMPTSTDEELTDFCRNLCSLVSVNCKLLSYVWCVHPVCKGRLCNFVCQHMIFN